MHFPVVIQSQAFMDGVWEEPLTFQGSFEFQTVHNGK